MAALSFVPFRTHHLAELRFPAAQDWAQMAKRFPEIARTYELPGLAWTALRGPRPVAAGGVKEDLADRGTGRQGECWTLFGPQLTVVEWRAVLRKTEAVLATAEVEGFRRLVAYVHADLAGRTGHSAFGLKLAKWLGFEVEGLMQRWGPADADTLLLARVAPRTGKREAA